MVFEVPESQRSIEQNVYKFKVAGKAFSTTKAKYLNGYELEALQSEDSEQIYALFGKPGSAAYKAVKGLDQEQYKALFADWLKDSGIDVGESPAS